VPPAQDVVSDTIAAITARLAARHDGLDVLRAVTDACALLLSADATGVLIADPRGGLEVASASDESARFVELLQGHTEEGPCVDCIARNTVITSLGADTDTDRWPRFRAAMAQAGLVSVYAFPLRLVEHAVGGLNLFFSSHTELPPVRMRLAQALADLAVLGLTQEREARRVERLAEQTLTTLNDRVHVGHAIGVIAGDLGVDPDTARALLSAHSTTTGQPLRDVARAVTSGTLAPRDMRNSAADSGRR
jgi:transcriptional regulator with GAF, ATPase, and Fis domain